jgi:hypothetical protein
MEAGVTKGVTKKLWEVSDLVALWEVDEAARNLKK